MIRAYSALILVIQFFCLNSVLANGLIEKEQHSISGSRSIEVISPSLDITIPESHQFGEAYNSVGINVRVKHETLKNLLTENFAFNISNNNPSYIIQETSDSFAILDDTQLTLASFSKQSARDLVNVLEQYAWARNLVIRYKNSSPGIVANFEDPRIGRLFHSTNPENYIVNTGESAYVLVLTISPTGVINVLYPTLPNETQKVLANGSLEFPILLDPKSVPGGEQILSIAVSKPTNSWLTYFKREWPLRFAPDSDQLKILKKIIDQQVNFSVYLHEFVSIDL